MCVCVVRACVCGSGGSVCVGGIREVREGGEVVVVVVVRRGI